MYSSRELLSYFVCKSGFLVYFLWLKGECSSPCTEPSYSMHMLYFDEAVLLIVIPNPLFCWGVGGGAGATIPNFFVIPNLFEMTFFLSFQIPQCVQVLTQGPERLPNLLPSTGPPLFSVLQCLITCCPILL